MQKVILLFNNRQNNVKLTTYLKDIMYFCCYLVLFLEKFKYPAKISVLLTNNKEIKKLNFKYRNKNKETDVLSFPANDVLTVNFKSRFIF